MLNTTSKEFFEAKYAESNDPWNFAAAPYELERYRAIVAALGNRRYESACEPGCSVGVLTERLAPHCDFVRASDISPTAVELARERCRHFKNVRVEQGSFTGEEAARCDLLVFAEIGYYFTRDQLRAVMLRALESMTKPSTLLACHWLGSSADHVLKGDEVHEVLEALPGLTLEHRDRQAMFRLDRWQIGAQL